MKKHFMLLRKLTILSLVGIFLLPTLVIAEQIEVKGACTEEEYQKARKSCDTKDIADKTQRWLLERTVQTPGSSKGQLCTFRCIPESTNKCGKEETTILICPSGESNKDAVVTACKESELQCPVCIIKLSFWNFSLTLSQTHFAANALLAAGAEEDCPDNSFASNIGKTFNTHKLTESLKTEKTGVKFSPQGTAFNGQDVTASKASDLSASEAPIHSGEKINTEELNKVSMGDVQAKLNQPAVTKRELNTNSLLKNYDQQKVALGNSDKQPIEPLKKPSIFDTKKSNTQQPKTFAQKFFGGEPLKNLRNFITQEDLRNTPQGGEEQPQIIYVVPNAKLAANQGQNESYRSIKQLASDLAAQTPGQTQELGRVEQFAQTLEAVGGPNEASLENKAYGRIQDLIVEDEALRALRVAEEKGKQAKNEVFCRVNEEAEDCNKRREERQKEVERKTFVIELEERVVPEPAITHFLAVYDGWVRPSPAPETHATSTLGVLHSQDQDGLAAYETITDGNNFVSWVIDSVTDAAQNAIAKVSNFLTGRPATTTPATQ